MGQKVHPIGFRIGIVGSWISKWFATKDFARYIGEDIKIRRFVRDRLQAAGISRIEIERAAARVRVNIHTAKPGLVIGKKGKDIEDLKRDLRNLVQREVGINIIEVRKPDTDAQLIAENIAFQLEKRVNYRRALKEAMGRALRSGAEGVKVGVGGRINGAEIARVEKYREGRVPLHTLRADIDYATGTANTTYGTIGIKVWVFKGEKFSAAEKESVEALQL
jgi:small subunit ribosomal protein S3